MPTDPARICPQCGAALPAGMIPGQCPFCLLGLGLAEANAEGDAQKADARDRADAHAAPGAKPHAPRTASLGDYELLEEIGRGGMGVVYRARQKSLDRIVALKLLLFGPHAPPESVKRFRAEAVATAALQHPNIVAIHEVGLCEGQHFLVMDLVEGPSLAKAIAASGFPISDFKRAAGHVKTIAEAVHYAHERGFLHRDLKPSNILIDANDEPRVTDFGLARRLAGDSELTVSGQVLGSPNYMPPEQASGQRCTLSRRSDVYALGAILYHALTGRPPFVGQGLVETVRQVIDVEPVSPRVLNPSVPADLETVCLKCLEKEPGKRYATAQLLAEELGRFLEGKPVLARPVSRGDKIGRWCRRNPRLALATGAVGLSLLIGLAGVSGQWRRAESQRARAEAEALIARRNAYAADMNLVQRALGESDLGSALELLNQYRPRGKSEVRSPKSEGGDAKSEVRSPKSEVDLRGWEWRYLWARCQSEEHFTLCQYSNAVSALAFSADGKWLAVRQEDGVVALWDTAAKRPVANLSARAARGRWCNKALAFSPREPLLAWGNTDTNGAPIVSLRDVVEQKDITRLPLSADLVSVAFSPDAQVLATLDYAGAVVVWDLKSKAVVTNFPSAAVDVWAERFAGAPTRSKMDTDHHGCVLFSPDGRWLAVGEAQPRIRLLNRVTGELREIPVLTAAGGITTLAFSPDSQRLAAGLGAGDKDVHVWDLGTGTETRLAGHRGWIVALAFSLDGRTLASASSDQTLRLWDITGKAERRRFQGHTDEVWALAWSPVGPDLVTGGRDGSVRFWDPAAKILPPYAVLPASVRFWGPAFSPDSRTFFTVTSTRGAVVPWDTASLQPGEELRFLGTNHYSVDLSRDGRWLALGDKVGNTQVWDFPGRRRVTNLVSQETMVFALIFSPGGNLLGRGAVTSDRRSVPKLWRVGEWQEISLQGINLDHLFECDCSPDERTLAIAYGDGTVAWWDLATGRRQAQFDSQYSHAVHVAFSPNGRLFATAGLNGLMIVWEVASQRAKLVVRGHRNALQDLTFSPDGTRLIASGTSPQGPIKLWDVETGRDLATLPGIPGWYPHIGFSPDGHTLFAASIEGTALLWRAPSWEEIEAAERKQQAPGTPTEGNEGNQEAL